MNLLLALPLVFEDMFLNMNSPLTIVLMLGVLLILYFLPSLVAHERGNPSWKGVLVLNLFLGWTFIGWVIALAWAFTGDRQKAETATRPINWFDEHRLWILLAVLGVLVIIDVNEKPTGNPSPEIVASTQRIKSGRESSPGKTVVANSPSSPLEKWSISEGRSAMDGSKTVTLALYSEDTIQGWLQQATPALVIRCLEHKTSVYVVTGMAAQPEDGLYDEYTVTFRLDHEKPRVEEWDQSTDEKALFAPNAIVLARELDRSQRLLVRFTPFNSSPATFGFDLGGLNTYLPKVAKACGWKP